jgi:hypothetical protein
MLRGLIADFVVTLLRIIDIPTDIRSWNIGS